MENSRAKRSTRSNLSAAGCCMSRKGLTRVRHHGWLSSAAQRACRRVRLLLGLGPYRTPSRLRANRCAARIARGPLDRGRKFPPERGPPLCRAPACTRMLNNNLNTHRCASRCFVFAPRTIRELRIDPAALALAKPAARVERESSMARRIGGAASRPVPRPRDSFFTPRRQLSPLNTGSKAFRQRHRHPYLHGGLFNIQFHFGLRRNETSGLG
jgi:hypothetical protein